MAIVLTRRNLSRAAQEAGLPVSGASGGAAPPDDTLTALLKLVPGEAAALYTTLVVLPANGAAAKFAPVVAFILGAALAAYLPWRDGQRRTPPVRPEPAQYVLQLLAFAAWSLSIRDWLAPFGVVVPPWVLGFAVLAIPVVGGLVLGGSPPVPAPAPNQ